MIMILAIALSSIAAAPAEAYTFYYGGVLMGTVCSNGTYSTSYPASMAQPVGSACPLRDGFNNVIGYGTVVG